MPAQVGPWYAVQGTPSSIAWAAPKERSLKSTNPHSHWWGFTWEINIWYTTLSLWSHLILEAKQSQLWLAVVWGECKPEIWGPVGPLWKRVDLNRKWYDHVCEWQVALMYMCVVYSWVSILLYAYVCGDQKTALASSSGTNHFHFWDTVSPDLQLPS